MITEINLVKFTKNLPKEIHKGVQTDRLAPVGSYIVFHDFVLPCHEQSNIDILFPYLYHHSKTKAGLLLQ